MQWDFGLLIPGYIVNKKVQNPYRYIEVCCNSSAASRASIGSGQLLWHGSTVRLGRTSELPRFSQSIFPYRKCRITELYSHGGPNLFRRHLQSQGLVEALEGGSLSRSSITRLGQGTNRSANRLISFTWGCVRCSTLNWS